MNNLHNTKHISEFLTKTPNTYDLLISSKETQWQSCNVPARLESNSAPLRVKPAPLHQLFHYFYSASRLFYKTCSDTCRSSLLCHFNLTCFFAKLLKRDMKEFTFTHQTYFSDSWHHYYFVRRGQVRFSTLRRLVPEENSLPLSQSQWANGTKFYPEFGKDLRLNAQTPSPIHSQTPKRRGTGCASSPLPSRPERNIPCHFTTTVLYTHVFPDEIQVAAILCNKHLQFLFLFGHIF